MSTQRTDASHPVLAALARFAEMPENWDSYGSRPISETALRLAHYVVGAADALGIVGTHACPVGGGGVQLEWDALLVSLEILIRHDGRIEYVQEFKDGEMRDGGSTSLDDVCGLLVWYRSATEPHSPDAGATNGPPPLLPPHLGEAINMWHEAHQFDCIGYGEGQMCCVDKLLQPTKESETGA